MKKLSFFDGLTILSRDQQKNIFGGSEFTHAPIGDGGGGEHCSQTGCEGKSSGQNCIIGGRAGICSLGHCAGTAQLLCYA